MARKPKTQPSTEAAKAVPGAKLALVTEASAPAGRGRRSKTAVPSLELPLAVSMDNPAKDEIEGTARDTVPTKMPGRRGPNRKPTQSAGAAIAPVIQDDAVGKRGQTSRHPEAETPRDLVEDDAPAAPAVSEAEASVSGDPVQPDLGPGRSGEELQQPSQVLDAPAPVKSAAQWDRTTDAVRFDWPAIEQIATHEGPNQGMAKLLIAARAEGANSRWPL